MKFDPLPAQVEADVKRHYKDVYGWSPYEKVTAMAAHVVATKPSCAAEIGVYYGRSFFPIASALRFVGARVFYAIDPWAPVGPKNEVEWWNSEPAEANKVYAGFMETVERERLTGLVSVIRKRSEDAAPSIPDGELDLLHVDGNHMLDTPTRDVVNYLPKVKPGGWIWMDDTCPKHWPSVMLGLAVASLCCDLVGEYRAGESRWALLRKR